ncbi:hypothetical protein SRHO_G00077630 [Serrasalmus rhombeus]
MRSNLPAAEGVWGGQVTSQTTLSSPHPREVAGVPQPVKRVPTVPLLDEDEENSLPYVGTGALEQLNSTVRGPVQGFNLRELRFAQAMVFVIEEINRDSSLLPNISVGYRIYDNCGSRFLSMKAAMALMNGQELTAIEGCSGQAGVQAIIGESESSPTIVLSRTTGPFKIPVISHSSTCECLSSRTEYPSFFRTIASDYYQSRALAQLVKHFGWSWVGAVNSDSDYGNNGMAIFLEAAEEEGICVEYSEKFDRSEPAKLMKVVDTIKQGTAKVVIIFVAHIEMNILIEQLILKNVTGFQMIGVEGWITAVNLITPTSYSVLGGSLGFDVGKSNIIGFSDYVVKEFWETALPCLVTTGNTSQAENNCSRYQDLFPFKNYNDDISELRYTNNIYNGVYAVAHSLHSLLKCTEKQGCEKDQTIQPWQVVESLKKVNFTTKTGEQVWFDSTGATAAKYDVINWQRGPDGEVLFKQVGYYDASLPPGQQFVITAKNIVWGGGRVEVSHAATCECLSSRTEYPSFFRTIASDYYQSRALAQLVKHFGWFWVGAVNSDSDYGNNGMAIFLEAAEEEGICVEYSEKFDRSEPAKLMKVVDIITKGTAKVIIMFVAHIEMNILVEQLILKNVTGFQMIGVEVWITAVNLITPTSYSLLGGSLGFDVGKSNIVGFADYVVKEFWETTLPCWITGGNASQAENNCSRYQDLFPFKNYNEDVSELRYANNIYNGVYAVAHSLHSLLKCTEKQGCEKDQTIQPWQVVESLKKVNFTTKTGEQVWFDSTGATAAKYDVINWQRGPDGEVLFKQVGYYDASLPPGQQFVITDKNIVWGGGKTEV